MRHPINRTSSKCLWRRVCHPEARSRRRSVKGRQLWRWLTDIGPVLGIGVFTGATVAGSSAIKPLPDFGNGIRRPGCRRLLLLVLQLGLGVQLQLEHQIHPDRCHRELPLRSMSRRSTSAGRPDTTSSPAVTRQCWLRVQRQLRLQTASTIGRAVPATSARRWRLRRRRAGGGAA